MNTASDSLETFRVACAKSFTVLLCAVLAGGTAAQDGQESQVDPPGRVGRLSETTGQVRLFSPSAGEWLDAVRNRPITSGDRLATENDARAELRIGSTTLRLDSATELEVLRIDDSHIELQLHNGSIAVRLRSSEAVDEFELRTGEGRFRVQRIGGYRFDRIDQASHVTVNSGSARYEGPGSALTVYSGQHAQFWLDAANVAQYVLTEPKHDAFTAWNSARDRSDEGRSSTPYVSPEMTGAEDLDRHGRWEHSDEHGQLWIPRGVAAGWAPYSSGHWVWIRPWGWTWVDDAPWGFAPFHYGRWVYYRSNWCWTPGTRVHRPVYAPALVVWVGGPRVGVSIGAPLVGWFPLAPREVYVPSYRVSPRYVREVNHTHVTHIGNVTQIVGNAQGAVEHRDFSNRRFPHAVTVVPAGVLTHRQAVAPAARTLREQHDSNELTRQFTRGAALAAAPVAALAARQGTLESRPFSARGIGSGAAAGPSWVRERSNGAAHLQRPPLRPDEARHGPGRVSGGPAASLTPPAMAGAQTIMVPQRPAQPAQSDRPDQAARPARPAQPMTATGSPPIPPVVPADSRRGNHALRQAPQPVNQPGLANPAPRPRIGEPPLRERGVLPGQEQRRTGRDRAQPN
ncbi:MAG: DUF6600 domain-containing protein [Burkholderiaceae bacterium]